jgi:hypothetical protein
MDIRSGAGAAICLMLGIVSAAAKPALICKDGHAHYGGSEFHANRLEAAASAIDAWRRVKAISVGRNRADAMFPEKEQLRCARTTIGDGWRCFVRGGPCHVS